MKRLLFAISFALLTLISCKKETGNMPSENYFEVKINNQSSSGLKSEGSLSSDNKMTIFLSIESEDYKYVAISFAKPMQTESIGEFEASYYHIVMGDIISDRFEIDKQNPFQLEITSFNSETDRIAGTFSFTLKRSEGFAESKGEKRNLFTGEFNISYKTYGE